MSLRESRNRKASDLLREEQRVGARSGAFKKELGLADLTLTQVLFIIGLPWIGVAAKLGPAHVVLWLAGMALFYLPSAVVVTYLNRLMPLEGGLYQWAKLGGAGERLGFLVAWNLWLFAILSASEIGLQVTQYLSYILPDHETLTGNKLFIGGVTLVMIATLGVLTTVGLGVGKWVHKVGGALMLLTFAAIIVLPWLNVANGALPAYHPLRPALPGASLLTINLLGKMGFGAFAGFEYVAIHAGECRNPVRAIARSVALASPIIACLFIFGTSSVLALVPQDRIDLIAPMPQVLTVGSQSLGIAAAVAPLAVLALLLIRVAQSSVVFAGSTRLPMVAGWDRLLPEWFTRLHPRYRTPVNSIVFVGVATLVLGLAGQIGVGKQEAFQLLWNAAGVFYALTYLVMFALPLVGLRHRNPAPPLWLRLCALSGLVMTFLFVALSIVPIVEVESRLLFALKLGGLIVVANLIGIAIYLSARRRRGPAVPETTAAPETAETA